MQSWLAIDVGNSRIKVGLMTQVANKPLGGMPATNAGLQGQHSKPLGETPAIKAGLQQQYSKPFPFECVDSVAISLGDDDLWSLCEKAIQKFIDSTSDTLDSVIVGSNQSGVDRLLDKWAHVIGNNDRVASPTVIRNRSSLPIQVAVDQPDQVGLDRLLNAIAAYHWSFPSDSDDEPSIVVDCGTATTIDLVSRLNPPQTPTNEVHGLQPTTQSVCFEGGTILPGFELAARALHQYTEVLPHVSIGELWDSAKGVLGKNTKEAISRGLFWSQVGAVIQIVELLSKGSKFKLLVTGGGAELLAVGLRDRGLEIAAIIPNLALHGLVIVAATS